jgi:biotin synthase-like enzyme
MSESLKIQYLIKGISRDYQFNLFTYTSEHKDAKFMEMLRLIHDFESLGPSVVSNDVQVIRQDNDESGKKKMKCDFCGMNNHTTENCRKRKKEEEKKLEAQKLMLDSRLRSQQPTPSQPPSMPQPSTSSNTKVCKYCRQNHDISECPKLKEKKKKETINYIASLDPTELAEVMSQLNASKQN